MTTNETAPSDQLPDDMAALQEVFSQLGGPVALARALNVAASAPSNWRSRGAVPHDQGADIERAVAGKVTADRLCPGAKFVRVPDASWPHPEGRPLLDTTRDDMPQAA